MKFTNLQDLTRQESGIAIFDNDQVIVCNWSSYSDSQLPISTPWGGVMGYDYGYGDEVLDHGETDDVLSLFDADASDVLYDANDEIQQLMAAAEPQSGDWFRIGDCLIIAPHGWC